MTEQKIISYLESIGIHNTREVVYNPSYDQLFEEECSEDLDGYERGFVTELGAVNVYTGIYTGRSPKDKYIVKDDTTRDTLWWTSERHKNDNKPISTEVWNDLKEVVTDHLSERRLFVSRVVPGQAVEIEIVVAEKVARHQQLRMRLTVRERRRIVMAGEAVVLPPFA